MVRDTEEEARLSDPEGRFCNRRRESKVNIIEKVRNLVQSFPDIPQVLNTVHVDFMDTEPTNYGLSSIGDELIVEDIIGGQLRQHTFMLYTTYSSMNDYERLHNSSALLELGLWLEQQVGCEITTTVNSTSKSGQLEKISISNGMLYAVPQEDELDSYQYQIQIVAEYTVAP